jgi:mRNA export factor
MDTAGPHLVIACADRHIASVDLRQGPDKLNWTTSTLKWQTRVVAAFPALTSEAPRLGRAPTPEASAGYVVGSIEGRVCVMCAHTGPGWPLR